MANMKASKLTQREKMGEKKHIMLPSNQPLKSKVMPSPSEYRVKIKKRQRKNERERL